MGARRLTTALALLTAVALLAGCGGSPRDLGTVQPRVADPMFPGPWTLVEFEGIVPGPAAVESRFVEVDPDGRTLTAFFTGGDPGCHAVAGVEIEHRGRELPRVTIQYGMRLWVNSCNAALYSLAIRLPLEPPFVP